MYQVNNSVIFSGEPMKAEELFDQMIETLSIIIDRRSKGRPRKRGSQIIEKIVCALFKLIQLG